MLDQALSQFFVSEDDSAEWKHSCVVVLPCIETHAKARVRTRRFADFNLDPNDITADAQLRLLKTRKSWRGRGCLRPTPGSNGKANAYLGKLVFNTCIDALRREQRHSQTPEIEQPTTQHSSEYAGIRNCVESWLKVANKKKAALRCFLWMNLFWGRYKDDLPLPLRLNHLTWPVGIGRPDPFRRELSALRALFFPEKSLPFWTKVQQDKANLEQLHALFADVAFADDWLEAIGIPEERRWHIRSESAHGELEVVVLLPSGNEIKGVATEAHPYGMQISVSKSELPPLQDGCELDLVLIAPNPGRLKAIHARLVDSSREDCISVSLDPRSVTDVHLKLLHPG